MKTRIKQLIKLIDEALAWTEINLGAQKASAHDILVNCRRRMKKIGKAYDVNPAAVVYGESQQGKSYLVSSLLSSSDESFTVIQKSTGKSYDFITEINPTGQGTESTSLVTRFTIKTVSPLSDFPVKVRMLSLVDIILVLCDSYYMDIQEHNIVISQEEIEEEYERINKTVSGADCVCIIEEDDILDIEDYFENHFKTKSRILLESGYFKKISRIAEYMTLENVRKFCSLLWNGFEQFDELLERLVLVCQSLNFSEEIYTSYSTISRDDATHHGAALLDVTRLHELYKKGDSYKVEVAFQTTSGFQKQNVDASSLCALAGEVVLQLDEKVVEQKPFLRYSDILDFPGARARLDKKNEQDLQGDIIIPQMLLRGKVAYFFNKYASDFMISALLFCHGKRQAGPRFMPNLLKEWIFSYIGDTPEKREKFIKSSKISPLFVVGTMFNLDLAHDQNDRKDDLGTLTNRWVQRFEKIYLKEMFGEDNTWLNNWTTETPYFDNLYLLRDFYYSSPSENNLFIGWSREEHTSETREVPVEGWPTFKVDLKRSFLDFDFVKKHFHNPEEAWDEAASVAHDGSQYIVRNLTIAAENMAMALEGRLRVEFDDTFKQLVSCLEQYYHGDNADAELKKAKAKATRLQTSLDIYLGRDPYCFGQMMHEMTLSEGEVYNVFHHALSNGSVMQSHDISEYAFIRLNAPSISSEKTYEENLQILADSYGYDNPEECRSFFEIQDVNLNDLFYGDNQGLTSTSVSLAESLRDYWFNTHLHEMKGGMINTVFGAIGANDLIRAYATIYDKIGMDKRISSSISKHLDEAGGATDEVEELVADISTEVFNKFILSFGFVFFTEDEIEELRLYNDKNNLGLLFPDKKCDDTAVSYTEISKMMEISDNLDLQRGIIRHRNEMRLIPGMTARSQWRDLIRIALVGSATIPNYDVQANRNLGELLSKICQ